MITSQQAYAVDARLRVSMPLEIALMQDHYLVYIYSQKKHREFLGGEQDFAAISAISVEQ